MLYFESMNIALPRHLEDYVTDLVRTSRYQGEADVVVEALREHQARRQRGQVIMTVELQRLLDEGLEHPDQMQTTAELR